MANFGDDAKQEPRPGLNAETEPLAGTESANYFPIDLVLSPRFRRPSAAKANGPGGAAMSRKNIVRRLTVATTPKIRRSPD
jgi:hypothetical protein